MMRTWDRLPPSCLEHHQVEIEQENQLNSRETLWCWFVCLREGLSPAVSPKGEEGYTLELVHTDINIHITLCYLTTCWLERNVHLHGCPLTLGPFGVTRACVAVIGAWTGYQQSVMVRIRCCSLKVLCTCVAVH